MVKKSSTRKCKEGEGRKPGTQMYSVSTPTSKSINRTLNYELKSNFFEKRKVKWQVENNNAQPLLSANVKKNKTHWAVKVWMYHNALLRGVER